jgi:hypothetical protein
MAVTIKQTEAIPESYPDVDQYAHRAGELWEADDDTNEVNASAIWQRIEAYTAHRWTARAVTWIVEGIGEWTPPLTPATIQTVEIWTGTEWETVTAPDSPLGGYWLSGEGPYRFTASVGGGDVPEAVQEAYRRLYEYSKGITNQFRGDASHAGGDGGPVYGWAAKSIQLSGAADLLRPYRRA